jgi:hypothetical protein
VTPVLDVMRSEPFRQETFDIAAKDLFTVAAKKVGDLFVGVDNDPIAVHHQHCIRSEFNQASANVSVQFHRACRLFPTGVVNKGFDGARNGNCKFSACWSINGAACSWLADAGAAFNAMVQHQVTIDQSLGLRGWRHSQRAGRAENNKVRRSEGVAAG